MATSIIEFISDNPETAISTFLTAANVMFIILNFFNVRRLNREIRNNQRKIDEYERLYRTQ